MFAVVAAAAVAVAVAVAVAAVGLDVGPHWRYKKRKGLTWHNGYINTLVWFTKHCVCVKF